VKRQEENRYPHSADLFKFCKEALSLRHNHEVKVIDGHVGALLDFDPADCSHWKRGKKNIKSAEALKKLSDTLQVDVALLTDIVSGKTDVIGAIQEYKGFGNFDLSQSKIEELKNCYLKSMQMQLPLEESSKPQEKDFQFEKESVKLIASELLTTAQVESCPVLIPEIIEALKQQELESIFSSLETTPHTRFFQAKELGRRLLYQNAHQTHFSTNINEGGSEIQKNFDNLDEVADARCNLFALNLLVPEQLFQRALKQVDLGKDFVATLAEIFWVSRSLIHARLQESI
jgi:hypothetical protein